MSTPLLSFDILHPKLLHIVREILGPQPLNRIKSTLSIDQPTFNINSFDGILEVLSEYDKRNANSNIYQKVLTTYISFISHSCKPVKQRSSSSSTSEDRTSSDKVDSLLPKITASIARISTSNGKSTSASLDISKPSKNQAPVHIKKVVNIVNNYYGEHSKSKASDSGDSDEDQTVITTTGSKTSKKSRRTRPGIVKNSAVPTVKDSDILPKILFPQVCALNSCRACSSVFMHCIKVCRDSTCTKEHCRQRHIPRLNGADRRNVRRVHATMDRSGSEVDAIVKVDSYLKSLPPIPEISDTASESGSMISNTQTRRSWADMVEDHLEPQGSEIDDDVDTQTSKRIKH